MLHRLLSRPLISRRIHSTRFILESNITPSPQNSYLQEVDWDNIERNKSFSKPKFICNVIGCHYNQLRLGTVKHDESLIDAKLKILIESLHHNVSKSSGSLQTSVHRGRGSSNQSQETIQYSPNDLSNLIKAVHFNTVKKDVELLKKVLISANIIGKNCHVKFTEKQIGWLCNFLTDPCYIQVPEGKNLIILITNKVNACTDDFTAASIGKMILGLKFFDSSASEVRELMRVFSTKINNTKHFLDLKNLENVMFGLRNMSGLVVEVRLLYDSIRRKIPTDLVFDNQQKLAHIIYGLRNLNSSHTEVQSLVETLARHIQTSPVQLRPSDIGMCLYGLRYMSSDDECVKHLLKVLNHKFEACNEPFNNISIASAFNGMRNMTSDVEEVRAVIKSLSKLYALTTEKLMASTLGATLYGMKNMSSNEVEVRELISVIIQKIKESDIMEFNGQTMANCLYGMRRMSLDHAEIREFAQILIAKFDKTSLLTPAQVYNAMHFLPNMTSDHVEVQKLVGILDYYVQNCSQNFKAADMIWMINFLRSLNSDQAEVRSIVKSIYKKLPTPENISSIKGCVPVMVHGLASMSSEHEEVLNMVRYITEIVKIYEFPIDNEGVEQIMHGMQRLDHQNSEVTALVAGIKEKIALNTPENLQIIQENMKKIAGNSASLDAVYRVLFS